MANLWLQAVCVGLIGLGIIRFVFGYNVLLTHWLQVMLPITRGAYWYLSAFSLLFVLSPMLNFAINGLGKRTLMIILLAIFAMCSLSSPWFRNEYNGFGMGLIDGYSTIWLLIMYCVGGYINKYKEDMPSVWICASVVMIGAFSSTALAVLVWAKIPVLSSIAFRGGMVGGYRNPLIVVVSISMFMLCVQSRFSNDLIRRCLKWGASVSFGVYLIHVHPYVWRYIWVPKLHNIHVHSAAEWIAWVLGGTLLVFVSCAAFESLRAMIFKFLRISRLASMADRITINE